MIGRRKDPGGPLRSWTCKGCTNTMRINGATYCRPMIEGRHRKEWRGNKLECLDKEASYEEQMEMELEEVPE